jgi:hypothetical protein
VGQITATMPAKHMPSARIVCGTMPVMARIITMIVLSACSDAGGA